MTADGRPTREDILDRARAMVPLLREKALQAERDRLIPVETHRAFQQAGFYRLFQPARYGGYEMPIGLMVEVAGELGRGCGSSAWIFGCRPGRSEPRCSPARRSASPAARSS